MIIPFHVTGMYFCIIWPVSHLFQVDLRNLIHQIIIIIINHHYL